MTTTVVALYDDLVTAQRATQELVDKGFGRQSISIAANDTTGEYRRYIGDTAQEAETAAADTVATDAGIGAIIGGIGGLLVGLGSLLVPGVGPVLAAGPLLTALISAGIGAGVGAITGGLVGVLVNMGVPEEEAHYYAEGIRRGGTLVTVQVADETAPQAREIMARHNPINVEEQANQWRGEGWSGFDPEATPYSTAPTSSQQQTAHEPQATAQKSGDHNGYNAYNTKFRRHYESNYPYSGYTYDDYAIAYRYGYDLANHAHYGSLAWIEVEPDARRSWEQSNEGTWDQFKAAVRYAWEEVKGVFDSDDDEARFRRHYNDNYARSGYDYERYAPAYRYGYDLTRDPRFSDRDWADIEPEVRQYWEERHTAEPWEQFKDAIRHGWEETKKVVGVG